MKEYIPSSPCATVIRARADAEAIVTRPQPAVIRFLLSYPRQTNPLSAPSSEVLVFRFGRYFRKSVRQTGSEEHCCPAAGAGQRVPATLEPPKTTFEPAFTWRTTVGNGCDATAIRARTEADQFVAGHPHLAIGLRMLSEDTEPVQTTIGILFHMPGSVRLTAERDPGAGCQTTLSMTKNCLYCNRT